LSNFAKKDRKINKKKQLSFKTTSLTFILYRNTHPAHAGIYFIRQCPEYCEVRGKLGGSNCFFPPSIQWYVVEVVS